MAQDIANRKGIYSRNAIFLNALFSRRDNVYSVHGTFGSLDTISPSISQIITWISNVCPWQSSL